MVKKDEYTTMGGTHARFPTTHESRISPARNSAEAIIQYLYEEYWRPVYGFIRHQGYDHDRAKDLAQGFFTKKVLGHEFTKNYDREKGRFRTFLIAAVKRYIIDQLPSKKHPPISSISPETTVVAENPTDIFDEEWTNDLLEKVLDELKEECYRNDKITHWQVFSEWFLEQDSHQKKPSMSEICARYKLKKVDQGYGMIANIKGRFITIIRRHIRPLVNSEVDIDDEIAYFVKIFSQKPPR